MPSDEKTPAAGSAARGAAGAGGSAAKADAGDGAAAEGAPSGASGKSAGGMDAGGKDPTAKTPPRAGVLDGDGGGVAPTPEAAAKDSRAAAGKGAVTALIANDDAKAVAPEQMRKSEFLAAARATAAGLDPGKSVTGGDQASQWLDYFERSSAATLEDAIHRFVPEAAAARSAHDYLRMLTAKARNEAASATMGGKFSGKPTATGLGVPGGGMPGLSFKEGGGAASGGGSAGTAGAAGAGHAGGGHAGSSSGGSGGGAEGRGGAHAGASPAAVSRQLGAGTPLHSGVRASMEAAFGVSFARVRLHTDRRAAELSDSLHARAFTVGEHVAFGPGEYRPDSPIGQALIAHELAHVVQQSGSARDTSVQSGSHTEAALEQEADVSAVQAVLAGQQGMRRGMADVKAQAMPRLKSSLRLSRCGCGGGERKDPAPSPTPEIEPTEEAVGKFVAGCVQRTKNPRDRNSGLWYPFEYRAAYPDDWKKKYESGLADDFYWEREKHMHWRLKPNRSASAAVKKWLDGLTIAECYAVAVAIQVNTIRAVLGDARFDELYGSQDKKMAKPDRLEMGAKGATPLRDLQEKVDPTTRAGAENRIGKRPAKVGEWYYFRNHPMYLLKHPSGSFQGENAFLMEDPPGADQLWGGFGLVKLTESELLASMVLDYNRDRDADDYEELKTIKSKKGGTLPPQYEPGFYPEKIKVEDIPGTIYDYTSPYTGEKKRFVGGFKANSGKGFNLAEIKKLLGPGSGQGSGSGSGSGSNK